MRIVIKDATFEKSTNDGIVVDIKGAEIEWLTGTEHLVMIDVNHKRRELTGAELLLLEYHLEQFTHITRGIALAKLITLA